MKDVMVNKQFIYLNIYNVLNDRVKQIQNELGTQILADFEEALSVKGVKV